MSGNLIGAEIQDMQRLSSNFKRQASEVDELMAALTSDVNATWWKGGAADRFRGAWESDYQPALRRLSEALIEASDEVTSRANALQAAGG